MAKKAIYNPITMQWETEDELKSKTASAADPVMSAMNRTAQPGGMVPQRAPLFPQDLAAAEKTYPAVQHGEPMPIPFAEGPTPLQAAITGANNRPAKMVPQRAPLFPQDLAAAEKAYPAVQYGEPMPIPFAEGPTPLQAAITGANNRPGSAAATPAPDYPGSLLPPPPVLSPMRDYSRQQPAMDLTPKPSAITAPAAVSNAESTLPEDRRIEAFRERMGMPKGGTNAVAAAMQNGRMLNARMNWEQDVAPDSGRIVTNAMRSNLPGGTAIAWATKNVADMVKRADPKSASSLPQQPQGVPGMPPPYPSREIPTPEQVRAAMGRMQPAPAVAAAAMPASAGTDAQDPMRGIPARDRLALQMWGGSNDTTRQAIDRFNSVARKYGMPLKEKPRDARAREALAASGRLWTPGSRGGAVNTMTGEDTTPAAPAEQIDWNKRIVKLADGTHMDAETKQVFGPKTPQEHDWDFAPDGRRIDKKSPTGAVVGLPQVPQGTGRFINGGENGMFDAVMQRWIPRGEQKKKTDANQGPIVKVATGGGDYIVGFLDKDKQVYGNWKFNVKAGSKLGFRDGQFVMDDATGQNISDVPDYIDKDMQQPDPAAEKAQTPPAGAATGAGLEAPVGYIHTYPSGRKMMKNKDGKWVPV